MHSGYIGQKALDVSDIQGLPHHHSSHHCSSKFVYMICFEPTAHKLRSLGSDLAVHARACTCVTRGSVHAPSSAVFLRASCASIVRLRADSGACAICISISLSIYIYIYRERERERERAGDRASAAATAASQCCSTASRGLRDRGC